MAQITTEMLTRQANQVREGMIHRAHQAMTLATLSVYRRIGEGQWVGGGRWNGGVQLE